MTTSAKPIILLVEPDPTALRAVTWFLSKAGHEVIRASSARSALDRIRGLLTPLSAALIEVELPDLDGIQLAEQIQIVQRELPTLFMTKLHDINLEGVLNAPHSTLLKPFSMSSMMSAMQSLQRPPSQPGRAVSHTNLRAQSDARPAEESSAAPRFRGRI
ncbi:MAG: response regulator [Polyangiaceae bacterium]